MAKVLFCATVDYHFQKFHIPYFKWFKEQGWEVHVAASGNIDLPYVDKKFNIQIERSPINKNNIRAYKQLKIIINNGEYVLIHCHTPMGGVLARLAARKARNKFSTKVIYTAHGFHFYKGAPIANWLIYYPIEKILAHYTDCLITINEEDYALAKNRRFKANLIKHVHGVGVNTDLFHPVRKLHKQIFRKLYRFQEEDFIMFYAAEFNKNKNQQFLIKSLARIKDSVPNAKLLLAGDGPLIEECQALAMQLHVEKMVQFLGYRNDVESFLKMSDIAVASSLREGLPVNIMEAMACGLPVIATDNRGHRELIKNGANGWIFKHDDINGMSEKINVLANNPILLKRLGNTSRKYIVNKYEIEKVLNQKSSIYNSFMDRTGDLEWVYH